MINECTETEVFIDMNINLYVELAKDHELGGCRCPTYLSTQTYCGPRQTVRALATLLWV